MPSPLAHGLWTIDPIHSKIGFKARHAGISTVHGSFTEATAHLTIDPKHITITSDIKVASLVTGNRDRDQHILSSDFLEAHTYPTMSFTSQSVTISGKDIQIRGDITIKGTTRPVEFTGTFGGIATDAFGTTRAGFSIFTVISRKDFKMTWNKNNQTGDVLISDRIIIEIDAEFLAPKNKPA